MTEMQVALLMGSDSDLSRLEPCLATLKALEVPCVARVLSAHRTPEALVRFLNESEPKTAVYLCAAGGAAHLAGVVAAHTLRPVIGIPMDNPPLGGLDALLATVQMPGGVPVASVAVGGGGPMNAALTACRVMALSDDALAERLAIWVKSQSSKVGEKDARLQAKLAE